VFISTRAYGYGYGAASVYYSHIGQNVIAAYDDFSGNLRNGVEIQNYAGYGAQIDQFVYLFDDTMSYNGVTFPASVPANGKSAAPFRYRGGSGVYENSYANAYGYYGYFAVPTNLYADLYVVGSTLYNNSLDGITVKGDANGPTYLIQHINVLGTRANYNYRSGFVAYAEAHNYRSLNLQYITLAGSTFDGNQLDGAAFLATQSFGPGSFGAAIQDVTIQGSDFSGNARDGLYASADAFDVQGRAEQHFTIEGSDFDDNGGDGAHFHNYAHDGVYYDGYNCGVVQGLDGGCAFVRQTIQIVGSDFSYNGGDGIYIGSVANNYGAVYNSSGRPANTPTLLMEYSYANGNGHDGLHIENDASNGSYIYSYAVLIASQFNNNGNGPVEFASPSLEHYSPGRYGIDVNSSADFGSLVLQGTVLYGVPGYSTTASGNVGDGLHVTSSAYGGTVLQLVGIYNSDLSHNGGSGASVAGTAIDDGDLSYPSIVAQYVTINNSSLSSNIGSGAEFSTVAVGSLSTTDQEIEITNSTLTGNDRGVSASALGYYGAAANQTLYFAGDTITGNYGDGVHVAAYAGQQSFVNQNVLFGAYGNPSSANSINANYGDGISISAVAVTAGNVLQNIDIYYTDASHNAGSGVAISSYSGGYYRGTNYFYFSHVQQNVIAAYDNFDHNHVNGFSVSNETFYAGSLNQIVELIGVSGNDNGSAGFYETSTDRSVQGEGYTYSTNLTSNIYLYNSSFSGNSGNGIDLRSFAFGAQYIPAGFGGYSYLIQHINVSGTYADGNGGSGLRLDANESGVFSLNAQYLTISGSEFDFNYGAGAVIKSTASYGPLGFGDTFEQTTISGSDFSHNGGNGLEFVTTAYGRQGRAEQHATINGSYMDYNGGSGLVIEASATDGVYAGHLKCTSVQGTSGGCAFVRQNVVVAYSDISHNTGDGISVVNYANNFGAIYDASGRPHSKTLYVNFDTVDHNGGDGIHIAGYVADSSTLISRVNFYSYDLGGLSASYNGHDGVYIATTAVSGVHGVGKATDLIRVRSSDYGISAVSNPGTGFAIEDTVLPGTAGSYSHTTVTAKYSYLLGSQDGIYLLANGAGAVQTSTLSYNAIGFDGIGLVGIALNGANQTIHYATLDNGFAFNGQDVYFYHDGTSTQTVN